MFRIIIGSLILFFFTISLIGSSYGMSVNRGYTYIDYLMLVEIISPILVLGASLIYFGYHSRKKYDEIKVESSTEFKFNRKELKTLGITFFVAGFFCLILFTGFISWVSTDRFFRTDPLIKHIKGILLFIVNCGLVSAVFMTSIGPVMLWLSHVVKSIALSSNILVVKRVDGFQTYKLPDDFVEVKKQFKKEFYIFDNKSKKFNLSPQAFHDDNALTEALERIIKARTI